jgi:hypothetical protein
MKVASFARALRAFGWSDIESHPKTLTVLFVIWAILRVVAIAYIVVVAWWAFFILAVMFKVLTGK